MSSYGALSSCGIAALALPCFADVLVVNAAGGAPYTDIQSAIQAAQDGDVVLIESGTYPTFVVRNKTLSITADTDETVVVAGPIRVQDLGAGKTVVLSGLQSKGTSNGLPIETHGLYMKDDLGSVRIELCTFEGMTGQPNTCLYPGSGAHIEDCADVALIACTMNGTVPNGSFGGHGGFGMTAIRSSVAVHDSIAHGADAGPYSGCLADQEPPHLGGDGARGGHGCSAEDSFVFASRATFHGGNGATGAGPDRWGGDGGTGFRLTGAASHAELLDCTNSGGEGGFGVPGLCGSCVVDGADGPPFFSQTPSALTLLPGSGRVLLARSPVREGAPLVLTFYGQPGDAVQLLASKQTEFDATTSFVGVDLVDATRARRIGTIGASGSLTVSLPFTDLGARVENRTLHLQPVFVKGGSATLGSYRVVVLLDSSF